MKIVAAMLIGVVLVVSAGCKVEPPPDTDEMVME